MIHLELNLGKLFFFSRVGTVLAVPLMTLCGGGLVQTGSKCVQPSCQALDAPTSPRGYPYQGGFTTIAWGWIMTEVLRAPVLLMTSRPSNPVWEWTYQPTPPRSALNVTDGGGHGSVRGRTSPSPECLASLVRDASFLRSGRASYTHSFLVFYIAGFAHLFLSIMLSTQ